MEESGVEIREVAKQPEIIDILDGSYIFHWTSIENLRKIFTKGIYSRKFAKRIGDKEFRKQWGEEFERVDDNFIYTSSSPEDIFGDSETTRLDFGKVVGIVARVPKLFEGVSRRHPHWSLVQSRIAPREFSGLVLVDKEPLGGHYQELHHADLDRLRNLVVITKPFILRLVRQLKIFFETQGTKTGPLPIYGTSGDLYWPKRMTHEEIVQMLGEKQEPEGVI